MPRNRIQNASPPTTSAKTTTSVCRPAVRERACASRQKDFEIPADPLTYNETPSSVLFWPFRAIRATRTDDSITTGTASNITTFSLLSHEASYMIASPSTPIGAAANATPLPPTSTQQPPSTAPSRRVSSSRPCPVLSYPVLSGPILFCVFRRSLCSQAPARVHIPRTT